MRKTAIIFVMFFIGLYSVAGAFDFEKKMGVGAFLDYGFGLGDAFGKQEHFGGQTVETKLGFSFGGQAMYGITSKIGIALVVDMLQWKMEYSGEGTEGFVDENEAYIKFNFNGMYFFHMESELVPFVEFGPGYYTFTGEGSDSHFGFNAGAGVFYFVRENLAGELGGRFHYLFSGESTESVDIPDEYFIEFHVGFKYFFGGME